MNFISNAKERLQIRFIGDHNANSAIILLRALATCLITNTHYNNVYPISSLAVGGLLGDVIFFFVSGFCYGEGMKENFIKWYLKRIIKIYPPVFVMVIINTIFGVWQIEGSWFTYFVYPTYFRFFGAIMLLYIPMYFIAKIRNNKHFIYIGLGFILIFFADYFFIVDKTQYRMNDVSNISCLFLYGGAILLGMTAKRFSKAKLNISFRMYSILLGIGTVLFTALYFISTVFIRKNTNLYPYQITVHITLLALLFFLAQLALINNKALKRIPYYLNTIVSLLSALTLEIYVVQRVIIMNLEIIAFPVNWIVITLSIILAAIVLRLLFLPLQSYLCKVIDKIHFTHKNVKTNENE